MKKGSTYTAGHLALVAMLFTILGIIVTVLLVGNLGNRQDIRSSAAGMSSDVIGETTQAVAKLQLTVGNMETAQSRGASASEIGNLARQMVTEQKMVEQKLQDAKSNGYQYRDLAENFQNTLQRQEAVLSQLMLHIQTQTQTQIKTSLQTQTQTALQQALEYARQGMTTTRQMLGQ